MEDLELRDIIERYMREKYGDSSDLTDAKGKIILMSNEIERELREERSEYFAWEDIDEMVTE